MISCLLGFAAFVVSATVITALNVLVSGFWLATVFLVVFSLLLCWAETENLAPVLRFLPVLWVCFLFAWLESAVDSGHSWIREYAFPLRSGFRVLAPVSLGLHTILSFRLAPAEILRGRQLLWVLVPVCLVAYLSGSAGSADVMVRTLTRYLVISPVQAQEFTFLLRKGVHIVFYGSVALFLYGLAGKRAAVGGKQVGFALGAVLLLASYDELRQMSEPSRTGLGTDVVLDVLAAAFFLGLFLKFGRSLGPLSDSSRA